MTLQEIRIRAREACAAETTLGFGDSYRKGEQDHVFGMKAALRALNDLDKPIPDPDEAWRPFLEAFGVRPFPNLHEADRSIIARIKAARHLMPPEES